LLHQHAASSCNTQAAARTTTTQTTATDDVSRVSRPWATRTVPLGNIKLCDLASLYIGTCCTFVCGTLFGWIKLIELYPPKQRFHIRKYDGLENIGEPSRTLEVSSGNSAFKYRHKFRS
jgi:hypothetical protein